jgi:hypothetical protein
MRSIWFLVGMIALWVVSMSVAVFLVLLIIRALLKYIGS